VTIATGDVTSERDVVTVVRRETPGDQRAVADEQRRLATMGNGVPVARQSVNAGRRSAPSHRGDVSDARACVARECRVVAIARTEGMTRRWIVTARHDDVTGRRRELPPNADDLARGVSEWVKIASGRQCLRICCWTLGRSSLRRLL
jgi:hypothetical protein